MADERTPLIQVVRVEPPRPRYAHSTTRRFCTVALGATLVVIVVLFMIPLQWLPHDHRHRHDPQPDPIPGWPRPPQRPPGHDGGGRGLSYDELVQVLKDTPSADKAREWSRYYTAGPHLAGKNYSQAAWTREKWGEFGVSSEIVSYETFVSYPRGHRLALLKGATDDDESGSVEKFATGQEGRDYSVEYECSLEEDVLAEDPPTGLEDRIPTFHGYSASGNVTTRYVYVNYGSREDFAALVGKGVPLKGLIALVRYGKIMRGMKVKLAQDHEMAGVIIYSDPGDDFGVTEESGFKAYPDGPARNPSSVQRGTVNFLSMTSGDPTTPGYPSLPGAPRVDPHWAIPSIPSHPISYQDALPLLKALNGHGLNSSGLGWASGGLRHKGVDYSTGPSPTGTVLNLYNDMEETITPIWDVIGVVNGTVPDETVILGNHRDAWIAGGAGDPNSGTAAIDEVVRSFGVALRKGWKPHRTLVFASWDGEELGLLGSTEWVEQFLPWLSTSALAYLNVDVAAIGPSLRLEASPLLNGVLRDAAKAVPSPNETHHGKSAYDDGTDAIIALGSGSDYAPFLDHAGIPSSDMSFSFSPRALGRDDVAVYHYHSNYDSFHWMETYGDPGFGRHRAVAQIWGLAAARLLESPVVAFNVTAYAEALGMYLGKLEDLTANASHPDGAKERLPSKFPGIQRAIDGLLHEAKRFDADAALLNAEALSTEVTPDVAARIRATNRKYKLFERQFLYPDGLEGREWFKHIVFAPR